MVRGNKFVFLLLLFCFFIFPSVNALEFDNVKNYNEELKVVTITNNFGIGDVIGQAKLNTPLNVKVAPGYQKVAEFDIWAYDDYNDAIKQFTFTDMKKKEKINRDFDIKMRNYKEVIIQDYYHDECVETKSALDANCKIIKNGSHIEIKEVWTKVTPADLRKNEVITIGIFTEVKQDDFVDWIPTIYGVKIEEWATWEADINVGLLAYWQFNISANDSHFSNDGTSHGATLTTGDGGKIGEAYAYDGINDDVSVPQTTNLSQGLGDANASFTGWVYLEDNLDNPMIMEYRKNAGGYVTFTVSIASATGKLQYIDDGDGREVCTSSGVVPTQEWVFLSIRKDKSSQKIYLGVNNTETECAGDSGSSTGTGYPIFFGRSSWDSQYLEGKIDEVGIWSRLITTEELDFLYNNYTGLTYGDDGTPPDAPPQVTLTSPVNYANLTSSAQDFVATVTDDKYVENVSLKINDIIVETKTTHVNGSYTFSRTITEGYHNWSILAYDNASQSNQSETRFYNYTQQGIDIVMNNPADLQVFPGEFVTTNFNCSAFNTEGVTTLNLTIFGFSTSEVTNSTPNQNLSIDVGGPGFFEGIYTWYCEAENLETYVRSANRTFNITYSTPDVTLGVPLNDSTALIEEITFTFNVTDTNGIENVSLLVDDVVVNSSSSGVNGSYTFVNTIATGEHNWTVEAYSSLNKLGTTTPYDLTIHSIAPTVTITKPLAFSDYIIVGENETLEYNISETGENLTEHLDECWYVYGFSGECYQESTNTSNQGGEDGDCDLDYSGSYAFNIGFGVPGSDNPNLMVDGSWDSHAYNQRLNINYTKPPFATLDSSWRIKDAQSGGVQNLTINESCWNANPSQIELRTITTGGGSHYYSEFQCFNSTDWILMNRYHVAGLRNDVYEEGVNWDIKRVLDCEGNTTQFEYTGQNNITVFAKDEYGLIGNQTHSWTYLLSALTIDYDTPVYEGNQNTITMTFDILSPFTVSAATLDYDGTTYSTNIIYSDGNYIISATPDAPLIDADENITFNFDVTINGVVYNPQDYNQTILNVGLNNCSPSGDLLMNMSLVEEELLTALTGDIRINAQLINILSGLEVENVSIDYDNSTYGAVCLTPIVAKGDYYLDAEIRYTSDDYSSEFYHIQNANLSSYPINLSLYDLVTNDTTEFKIVYQDSTFNFIKDAVIQLQRKYISENIYRVVEAPLTSDSGFAIVHIDLNSRKYKATVVKDGVVLDYFDNIVFNCENELTGECEQKLLGSIDSNNDKNLDTVRDFSYSEPVADNDTITTTFSIPSGTPSSVNIVLTQRDQFGNTSLCNQTIVSSGGSISCNFSESLGESYIVMDIFKNGEIIAKKSYIIHPTDYLDWLGNNYILIFILLLSLVGMALSSPEWIIINGILTMVIAGGLYLASGLNFVVGLGNIAWLIFAAIILISKMAKQEDR